MLNLVLLLLAGVSLGGAYFGGLWFTLQRLPRWRRPFLSVGLSLGLRLGLLLGGGAWLWQQAIAPPLATILALSAGVWISRTLLLTTLLAAVERAPSVQSMVRR